MLWRLTGKCRHLPCSRRCRRRTCRWRVVRLSQRRWSGRGCRRWGCWRRSSGSWWHSQRLLSAWEPSWWSWEVGGHEEPSETSSQQGFRLQSFPWEQMHVNKRIITADILCHVHHEEVIMRIIIMMMMMMMTAHVISMIKEVRAQETTIKSMQFHISRM